MPKIYNKSLKKQSIKDTPNTVENGWLGLSVSSGNIYEDKRADFKFPQSIKTFDYMRQDPVIAAANNIIDIMICKVDWSFYVPDNATLKEKAARDFLNWCMNNMEHTWKYFIEEVGSYRIYGFSVFEKIYREVKYGKYSGKFSWKKLPIRSQNTIHEWVFDDNKRNLLGFRQSLEGLDNIYKIKTDEYGLIYLPCEKIILFSYKGRKGNPEGHSPLKDCYQPWTYKKTIESYEAVGVAKDLGGVPVLGVDATWLAKAQENSSSSEGQVLATLTEYMQNLHAGEQTYMILPIAYNDIGKELFTFELIGVDGGGKQYNTRDIINGKQLEILMLYLADILNLGHTSSGSLALAENKQNLLSYGIEYHLGFIKDVIDFQLIPQTLRVNGWGDLPFERMPKLTHTDLEEEDIDQLGKFIQRIASVNFLPRTKEVVNEILSKGKIKYELQDGDVKADRDCKANILYEEIFSENESGASEGMEEGLNSGTGAASVNNTAINMDNKA